MIRGAEYVAVGPTDFNQGFSENQFLHFHPPQEEKMSVVGESQGSHTFCIEDRVILCKKTPHSATQGTVVRTRTKTNSSP